MTNSIGVEADAPPFQIVAMNAKIWTPVGIAT
jgi:hypothetical protein